MSRDGIKGQPQHSSRGVSSKDDSYRHNGSMPPATIMVRVKTMVAILGFCALLLIIDHIVHIHSKTATT